jgi:dihydroxyacid dehydratase/phosphogluconate dehydratase
MASNQLTTATNVQAPDLSNASLDPNKFFNNYFSLDMSVGAVDDALTAYFEKYTGSATSGKALAAAVLYTAKAQNLDPMAVMAEFNKLTPGQLNNYLAAFLNVNRAPTSFIGIKTTTSTSPYITRSILP